MMEKRPQQKWDAFNELFLIKKRKSPLIDRRGEGLLKTFGRQKEEEALMSPQPRFFAHDESLSPFWVLSTKIWIFSLFIFSSPFFPSNFPTLVPPSSSREGRREGRNYALTVRVECKRLKLLIRMISLTGLRRLHYWDEPESRIYLRHFKQREQLLEARLSRDFT